jgi:hypothetical protein
MVYGEGYTVISSEKGNGVKKKIKARFHIAEPGFGGG